MITVCERILKLGVSLLRSIYSICKFLEADSANRYILVIT